MAQKIKNRTARKFTALDFAALAQRTANSIDEFCALEGICRATFNNWVRAGIGPVVMRIGGRRLITKEAREGWHRQLESNPLPKRGTKRKTGASNESAAR